MAFVVPNGTDEFSHTATEHRSKASVAAQRWLYSADDGQMARHRHMGEWKLWSFGGREQLWWFPHVPRMRSCSVPNRYHDRGAWRVSNRARHRGTQFQEEILRRNTARAHTAERARLAERVGAATHAQASALQAAATVPFGTKHRAARTRRRESRRAQFEAVRTTAAAAAFATAQDEEYYGRRARCAPFAPTEAERTAAVAVAATGADGDAVAAACAPNVRLHRMKPPQRLKQKQDKRHAKAVAAARRFKRNGQTPWLTADDNKDNDDDNGGGDADDTATAAAADS